LKRVVYIGADSQQGMASYARILAMGERDTDEALRARQAGVAPNDIWQMQITRGSRCCPKNGRTTHAREGHNECVTISRLGVTVTRLGVKPGDRFVSPMPFFHVAGSLFSLLGPLAQGATLIPLIAFDPAKQLELIARERGTHSMGVPTMLIAMLNHPRFAEF